MARTYTRDEAAQFLGVSEKRIRQLVLDGTLKTELFGREKAITHVSLMAESRRRARGERGPGPKGPWKNKRADKGKKRGAQKNPARSKPWDWQKARQANERKRTVS